MELKTANEFSMYIETLALSKNISHIDAILDYCNENYLDPADVTKHISRSLKAKIESEFRELNYLPQQAQLDI